MSKIQGYARQSMVDHILLQHGLFHDDITCILLIQISYPVYVIFSMVILMLVPRSLLPLSYQCACSKDTIK